MLEQRATGFAAGSDAVGNPPLYLPVQRVDLAREGTFVIADPLQVLAGHVAITSTTRLWGGEANVYRNLVRTPTFSFDALAGFRYLDLAERLSLGGALNDPVFNVQQSPADSFATRDQFYGGQVGGRVGLRHGPLSADLTGAVALGVNHQSVDILGETTLAGTVALPGTFAGGVFSQPSNIGRTTHDEFAIVPQARLKVGYDIRPWVRATVAYDFLYWSNVVRPGNQIDHAVNPTQGLGGPLVGPALPSPLFNRSDFFAHGVSFGLEFRY